MPMLSATAAETKQIEAEQLVERRVITVDAAGFETVTFESAKLVKPGDYLRYSIQYENKLDAPAEDIILTMPLPDVMEYVVGSAAPKSYPHEVSFDAGATFQLAEENAFPLQSPCNTHTLEIRKRGRAGRVGACVRRCYSEIEYPVLILILPRSSNQGNFGSAECRFNLC